MKILPDYQIDHNYNFYVSGYGSFGEGFGDGYGYGFTPDHGYGDGLGYGDGNGDSDIAFKVMHRKYPHNLIIL